MNPAGEPSCGVVFGGGEKAISHVPLLKSIINVVIVDGKYNPWPVFTGLMYQN
jgi:hypothetical protein